MEYRQGNLLGASGVQIKEVEQFNRQGKTRWAQTGVHGLSGTRR